MYFDTHAHLDDRAFDLDRSEIIKRMEKDELRGFINIGADIKTTETSRYIASKHPNIYFSAGVHPNATADWKDKDLGILRGLASDSKCVAIGEIGLDYYRKHSPHFQQKKSFLKQLELALELDLPVVIHCRDAYDDTFDLLRLFVKQDLKGVFHFFSGNEEQLDWVLNAGFYIGIDGPITYSKKKDFLYKQIPPERVVMETDCPYLTPQAYRGKRNEPAYIKYVYEKYAQIQDMDIKELCKIVDRNIFNLFKIRV